MWICSNPVAVCYLAASSLLNVRIILVTEVICLTARLCKNVWMDYLKLGQGTNQLGFGADPDRGTDPGLRTFCLFFQGMINGSWWKTIRHILETDFYELVQFGAIEICSSTCLLLCWLNIIRFFFSHAAKLEMEDVAWAGGWMVKSECVSHSRTTPWGPESGGGWWVGSRGGSSGVRRSEMKKPLLILHPWWGHRRPLPQVEPLRGWHHSLPRHTVTANRLIHISPAPLGLPPLPSLRRFSQKNAAWWSAPRLLATACVAIFAACFKQWSIVT